MTRLLQIVGISVGLFFAVPTLGEVVRLKDGSKLEGDIKRTDDGWQVTTADGKITRVTSDKVAGIDIKPVGTPEGAMSRLQSLRHSVENLPEIKQVLERYQAFIKQNPDTPAATEAAADMQIWRDRQAQGLVKVGDKWMTPEDKTALQFKSLDTAIRIHDLMKQSQLKDATVALDKAITSDPQNPSLLYLRGVLLYMTEKLAPARKSFEQVIVSLPEHAPTLNNMAIILWRQNAFGGAMTFYDRALLAAPNSRDILDNIMEALNALPADQRKSPAAQKLARHFKDQDDTLQKTMAAKGQYRWGSSWVDEAQMKKIQETEKSVREEMARMDADYTAASQQYDELEKRVRELQNAMVLIEAQTYQTGPDGKVVQYALPPIYYQYAKDLATARQQQGVLKANADRLRGQAGQVQKRLPVPTFKGIQRIIDADGMPVPAPPKGQPATLPATRPAVAQ